MDYLVPKDIMDFILPYCLAKVANQTYLSASKQNYNEIPFHPSIGVPRHLICRCTTDFPFTTQIGCPNCISSHANFDRHIP